MAAMRDARRRTALVWSVIVATVVMVGGSPASAKMPPFCVELLSSTVEPRTVVEMTVRFVSSSCDDAVVADFPGGVLDGVLGLYPAAELGDNGRPTGGDYRPVAMRRERSGVYRGKVRAPAEEGRFAIVAFPQSRRLLPDVYPQPTLLTVVSSQIPAVQSDGTSMRASVGDLVVSALTVRASRGERAADGLLLGLSMVTGLTVLGFAARSSRGRPHLSRVARRLGPLANFKR